MDKRATLLEMARRLRDLHPDARYELDWKTPEQLLVATILAGGARDTVVNKVTPELFKRWPDARALSKAKIEDIAEVVRPCGMGETRAKWITGTFQALVERFGGKVPPSMEDMLTLPGVQRKTANVVLTNALNLASGVVVDLHVTRVSQRMGLTASDKPEVIERELMDLLPQSSWIHFGCATILHGRYTCTAKAPKCDGCPMADLCQKIGLEGGAEAGDDSGEEKPKQAKKEANVAKAKTGAKAAKAAKGGDGGGAMELPSSWRSAVGSELTQPYFRQLSDFLEAERASHQVFPPADEVFTAFDLTPYDETRVLLLGQDPYHDDGQAHGLCFSVKPGIKPPPSLMNMYKELQSDIGCDIPKTGCLVPWAKQGMMMLNAVLTVQAHQPNSHKDKGWEKFTDAVIRAVNAKPQHVVFVLWGSYARKKVPLIDASKHTIVEGAHPSPLSAKLWFGSKPFSKINAALKKHGQPVIDWQITD